VDTCRAVRYRETSTYEPEDRHDHSAEPRVGRLSDVQDRLGCSSDIVGQLDILRARQHAPLLETGRAVIVSTFLPHDPWAA
jgi:hypothetical protein